jgi:hypothetical protein
LILVNIYAKFLLLLYQITLRLTQRRSTNYLWNITLYVRIRTDINLELWSVKLDRLFVSLFHYVEIKCQLDATEVFIADLTAYSTRTKNTHTRPPRNSTHLITNLDNTRHLILRTNILPNLLITFYIFTVRNTTGSNHCIILLSSWWLA